MKHHFVNRRTLIAVVLSMAPTLLLAQSFSPYSDFQNMTDSELGTLQVKLTYGGPQEEPIATIVLTGQANSVNVLQFQPFHHPGFSYGNDSRHLRQFVASTAQLRGILQNAALVPAVPTGGVGSPPYLSFGLVNTIANVTKGFEVILTPGDASALVSALRSALTGNPEGLAIIDDFACITALRGPGVASDVSTSVTVKLGGVRLNRSTRRYVGTATLHNNAASEIPLPVSLVLGLPQAITLFNSSGNTCAVAPVGRPYSNAPLSAPLQPGANVEIKLEFVNPTGVPITASTKVLAGPGGR